MTDLIVGVPAEQLPGERRVALIPDSVAAIDQADVLVQAGAGLHAGYSDDAYVAAGAQIVTRDELFAQARVILQVRTYGADASAAHDLPRLNDSHTIVGFADPLDGDPRLQAIASTGATLLAMELMPRITRAQSMDALSAMATLAGYKAVLLAATELPRIFPLLMTAAGTLAPARVLVVGAGVAGLQAIASARRLGARVAAYDVRPAVKEQVQSLGADFVELDLQADDSEDAGGYARAQDEAFYDRQRAELGKVVAESDVVITTAAIPGQPAPLLVTTEAVRSMPPGAVIVDLAAERGGNCEPTQSGQTVVEGGTTVMGPSNLPASVPAHASQMYAHNILTFLKHLQGDDGALHLDMDDEITAGTLVTRGGAIVHPRLTQGKE